MSGSMTSGTTSRPTWPPVLLPQVVRTFSFKGMTSKLFGQEAPEQREARLKQLEDLISEGEEDVQEKTAECE